MGVHHAWGRTLKDVFQRYKALRGFDQRYQNGFDCQGLWVEVEVEKALGLNSKRDIEEYGLAEFAAPLPGARRRVLRGDHRAVDRRLGQWMDWDNDYYTFSDTNIEYIWRFLKEVHRAGLALPGPPLDAVVPALRDVALPARAGRRGELQGARRTRRSTSGFPLKDREGEALVVWTTTPWTLPANVAAAVKPDARVRAAATAAGRSREADDEYDRRRRAGEELVGLEYEGPFDDLAPQQGIVHRVIPWDEVSLDRGHRDRPHRAGRRHRGLRALAGPRPAGARPDRRGGRILPRATARSQGCRPARSRSR